jgi:hypothetical protein
MKRGWVVRCEIFSRRGQRVYHPAGRRANFGKGGRSLHPVPPYRPPPELRYECATRELAEQLAADLRHEHGSENIAIAIEEIGAEQPPVEPVGVQSSLARDFGWERQAPKDTPPSMQFPLGSRHGRR